MKKYTLQEIPKTAEGLRDCLFDEINGLRTGKGSVQQAKVIAQLAHRIIEAARLSIQIRGRINDKNPIRLGQETKNV